MDQGQANKDSALDRIAVRVRMELARIIDPRHDRDAEMVIAEVAAIWDVLHHALAEIVTVEKKYLDSGAAAMPYSTTAAQVECKRCHQLIDQDPRHPGYADAHPCTPEDTNDAEAYNTPSTGDAEAADSKRKKRTRSQVPL